MSIPVLICDDSSFARKQIARGLPESWNIDITYAAQGRTALDAVIAGKADVMFLDLNMPVMDGFEVLKAIKEKGLSSMVFVVSGDIQQEAHDRVMALGATAFVKKPLNENEIATLLKEHGLVDDIQDKDDLHAKRERLDEDIDLWDCYREVANIAIGQAAEALSHLLDVFVEMPIPNVRKVEPGDIVMVIEHSTRGEGGSVVCQGFVGSGIAGEALLIFNESNYKDIAELLKYDGKLTDDIKLELLMEVSSIFISACLHGIANQLDIDFSIGHPVVLGTHVQAQRLIERNSSKWNNILQIEMETSIENKNINCNLLILIPEDSLESLNKLVSYLAG